MMAVGEMDWNQMEDTSSSEEVQNQEFVESLVFTASNKNMIRDLLKDLIHEIVEKKCKIGV
jgi:hypothetical protein